MRAICAALILVLLAGCAGSNTLTIRETKDSLGQPVVTTTYDLTDTGMYHRSLSKSDIAKAELARVKAKSISDQDLSELSTDAQAIIRYKNSEEISTIAVTPYSGKAPTTAADMGVAAIEVFPAVVSGTVKGVALIEAGKTMREVVRKDTVSVEDSEGTNLTLNREDNDQTQVATAAQEGVVSTAPQERGKVETVVTPESEEAEEEEEVEDDDGI